MIGWIRGKAVRGKRVKSAATRFPLIIGSLDPVLPNINFPPPVRQKLKVSYEDLVPWNPGLVYADITGYGDEGRDTDLRDSISRHIGRGAVCSI